MGRGGKEGSGQKTRGERQQLSLGWVLTTSITDEETEAQNKFQNSKTSFPQRAVLVPRGLTVPVSVTTPHCPRTQRPCLSLPKVHL